MIHWAASIQSSIRPLTGSATQVIVIVAIVGEVLSRTDATGGVLVTSKLAVTVLIALVASFRSYSGFVGRTLGDSQPKADHILAQRMIDPCFLGEPDQQRAVPSVRSFTEPGNLHRFYFDTFSRIIFRERFEDVVLGGIIVARFIFFRDLVLINPINVDRIPGFSLHARAWKTLFKPPLICSSDLAVVVGCHADLNLRSFQKLKALDSDVTDVCLFV